MKVMPEPAARSQPQWGDLAPLLDEELSRLPERYRLPVVLCDLEGQTRREVARRLGLPDGTLSNRLAKGRDLLVRSLARRGVALPAGAIAALLSAEASAAVPAALVTSTTVAAASVAAGGALTAAVSPAAASLTKEVVRAMTLKKLGKVALLLFVLAAAGTAGGLVWQARAADRREEPKGARAEAKDEKDEPEPKHAEKAAKEELKKLAGTWYLVGGASRGQKEPPEEDIRDVLKRGQWQKLVITGDRFVWGSVLREDAMKGDVKVDAARKPRTLNLTFERDGKTVKALCIYELDGDRLRLAYSEGERPKQFQTKADAEWPRVYVWRRLKR